MNYFFIGAGGILGAITRFSLSRFISRKYGEDFPLATFIINISGAFILGLLVNFPTTFFSTFPYFKIMLTTGFLGSYTTFSTFTYEAINLFKKGAYKQGLKYMLLSYTLGIISCFAAYYITGR